jgi:hypothetical protein
VILDALRWLAVADAVAAVSLATTIYAIGRRSAGRVSVARALGLAVLLASPAAALYAAAWMLARLL